MATNTANMLIYISARAYKTILVGWIKGKINSCDSVTEPFTFVVVYNVVIVGNLFILLACMMLNNH